MSWAKWFVFVFLISVCLILSSCNQLVIPVNVPNRVESFAIRPLFALHQMNSEQLKDGTNLVLGGPSKTIQILHVWASWCQPCDEEAPELVRFTEKLPEGVTFVGINASAYDDRDEALDFAERHDWTFPLIWDRGGEIVKALKITSYPSTVFVDQMGQAVLVHTGPLTVSKLQEITEAIRLRESPNKKTE